MKTFYTYILSLIALTIGSINSVSAQIFETSVDASYTQMAFYNITTGESVQVPNDSWDIAFSGYGVQDGAIFINEAAGLSETAIALFEAPIHDWAEPIDESLFTDEFGLLNSDLTWDEGAFNTVADPNSPFDYGWGAYDPSTHQLLGTRVYVLRLRDGSFLKMQVVSLSGSVYTFQSAQLDGSNEVTATIDKSDAGATSGLIYFSFATGDKVEMPEDYDLIFRRYYDWAYSPTDTLMYSTTGVLLARNREAVVVRDVDPYAINEADYRDQYSPTVNQIGYDWKVFDFASGWIIDEERANFVKRPNGDIYKIIFLDFEGSSTGTTVLEQSYEGNSATRDFSVTQATRIYPNPTADYLHFTTDKNVKEAHVTLTDISTGIQHNRTWINGQSISLHDFTSGTYHVAVITDQGQLLSKSIIQVVR